MDEDRRTAGATPLMCSDAHCCATASENLTDPATDGAP